jgi:hypothetical protein
MNMRTLLLAAGSILGIAASAAGQVGSVTLQWDASPDSSATGYIVFVGSASGSYQEQFDAGLRTSFVYTKAVAGRPYFFSVAAYSSSREVGPRSEEVLFLAGATAATGLAVAALEPEKNVDAARGASAAITPPSTSGGVCLAGGACYRVEPVANLAGDASALTRASDTRVFFIEGGKRVRVIEDGALLSDPALSADPPSIFAGLALDPGFDQSRYVYVGVVDSTPDGGRQLNIVRYREVANSFGEGAAIVVGLPLSSSGHASFTVDESRRIYVAMPAESVSFSHSRPSRYAGMVLRFESDGTAVRDDGADAPVFSAGYAQPAALGWSGADNALWLAGLGDGGAPALARLPVERTTAIPRASAQPSSTDPVAVLVLVNEAGGVFHIVTTPGGIAAAPWIAPNEMGDRIVAARGGASDSDLYVATTGVGSPAISRIVRLRRQ